jgi:hypothetical protein
MPHHKNGQCTLLRTRFGGQARLPENWSHGQSNFASHYAMLRMEKFQMTRATDLVGRQFHGLRVPGARFARDTGTLIAEFLIGTWDD